MKILVIDDEESISSTLGMLLEASGFTVRTAADGKAGVDLYMAELATGTPFGLVITDFRMPIKPGDQVIKEILDAAPDQRMILMTAYGNDALPKEYLSRVIVVAKPFDLDEFIQTVQNLASQIL